MDKRLFECAKRGEIENLKRLLSSGGRVTAESENYGSLLHAAVLHRQKECALALIEIEPSLLNNKNNAGRTPLLCACHPVIIQEMVEILAAFPSCLEIADDDNGRTALHHVAAHKEGLEATSTLLAYKANVHARDSRKNSVLHLAILSNNHATVRLLVEHGAVIEDHDVLSVNIVFQWPMLQLLIQLDPSIVNRISVLDRGRSYSHWYPPESSLLMRVAHYGSHSQVQELLDLGATDLTRALVEAIQADNIDNVKTLIDRGASFMDIAASGMNAFQIAYCAEAEQSFQFLLDQDWPRDCFIGHDTDQHPQALVLTKHRLTHFLKLVIQSKWIDRDLLICFHGPVSYMLLQANDLLNEPADTTEMLKILVEAQYPLHGPGWYPLEVICSLNSFRRYTECVEMLLAASPHIPVNPSLTLTPRKSDLVSENTDFLELHYGLHTRLFMPLLHRYDDMVSHLLPFYAGPPISLLLIPWKGPEFPARCRWSEEALESLLETYWVLICHGLPLGTETARRLKISIGYMTQPGSTREEGSAARELVAKEVRAHFHDLQSCPPSLVTLCKFAYRRVLGKLAAATSTSLPEVVRAEVLPGLRRLFEYDTFPTTCLQSHHCSCPEHLRSKLSGDLTVGE